MPLQKGPGVQTRLPVREKKEHQLYLKGTCDQGQSNWLI